MIQLKEGQTTKDSKTGIVIGLEHIDYDIYTQKPNCQINFDFPGYQITDEERMEISDMLFKKNDGFDYKVTIENIDRSNGIVSLDLRRTKSQYGS